MLGLREAEYGSWRAPESCAPGIESSATPRASARSVIPSASEPSEPLHAAITLHVTKQPQSRDISGIMTSSGRGPARSGARSGAAVQCHVIW
jgi:hypothetical protein